MSVAVSTSVRRWLVPAAAALAVIAGGVAIGLVASATDDARGPRTAHDLLVDLQTAQVDGLQGTLALRTDLGLPPLPIPSVGTADLGSLATGTHTLRVWYSHPVSARVALLGLGGETDIVTNGEEVWIWSSKENTAVHSTLPEGGLAGLLGGALLGGGVPGLPSGMPSPLASTGGPGNLLGGLGGMDPDTLARLVLAFLERFETDVTTDGSASVAGRDAYELVISPRDPNSLIRSIVIDIDAEERIPLRLAVLARDGGTPAFELAFTEVSFDRPDPAQFEFNPPPGATVVEEGDRADDAHDEAMPDPQWTDAVEGFGDLGSRMTTVGTGWTTVVVVDLGEEALSPTDDASPTPSFEEMLALLPTVGGDWGSGRLLSTRLFSVLLTDDGRLLAGAVSPERLYEVAAGS